jgi:hypothetical protein
MDNQFVVARRERAPLYWRLLTRLLLLTGKQALHFHDY